MANIIRGNQNREVSRDRSQQYSADPFRMVDALLRWDPLRAVLGDSSLWSSGMAGFSPSFDVKESKDAYIVRVDLPGVREADVEVTVTGNVLTVSGRREQDSREEGDQYFALERSYGSFVRSLTMPEGASLEDVKAELKDGVLTLHVPKRPEVQPRKISIGKNENQAKS
jgi:HSP20 family protein